MIVLAYQTIQEKRLRGRYITLDSITPILDTLPNFIAKEIIGTSEQGRSIPMLHFGNGPKKVFGWSQMHGNESTTTKAIFDFIALLGHTDMDKQMLDALLNRFSFYFIPILNPDGAQAYTRENGNGVDLNRDAQACSQRESRILIETFERIKPDLCLNLHGQRTIYGLDTGNSATVSFLAPAADTDRSITSSREEAMRLIARMHTYLSSLIPHRIGRYDDSFNPNCVGDRFQMAGVPTILFEAGHYPGDYQREKTRQFIYEAFLCLFGIVSVPMIETAVEGYFSIPENNTLFRDIVLRNVSMNDRLVDIAIQYKEKLENNTIIFEPMVDSVGDLSALKGHVEKNLEQASILINSHENVFVDEKIATIVDKSSKKPIKI